MANPGDGTRPGWTRRDVLRGGALLAASLASGSWSPRGVRALGAPRIVVVGAGLAGLTAAYQLSMRYRLPVTVFEAQSRVGGRTFSLTGWPGGQWADRGAQFVSTTDRAVRRLARRLGVPLIDTRPVYPDFPVVYRFGGVAYDQAALKTGLDGAARAAAQQARDLPFFARYDNANAHAAHLDQMTVADWIEAYVPGGLTGVAGRYLTVYFEAEYAGRATEASALHMIYDFEGPGAYDERYVVAGGAQSIAQTLAATLPVGSLYLDMPLIALHPNPDGSVRCTFGASGGPVEVDADHVILALPFSVLRDVSYAAMNFDPRLDTAVRQLGMGVNTKLNLQFDAPAWQPASDGSSYSDLATGSTFPGQVGLPGSQGIMIAFNVGDGATGYGTTPAHGPAPANVVSDHLGALEQLFPGVSGHWNGNALLDYWPADPWVKGSYAFYRAGQFTTLGGIEGVPQGRIHLAGEHTASYPDRGLHERRRRIGAARGERSAAGGPARLI